MSQGPVQMGGGTALMKKFLKLKEANQTRSPQASFDNKISIMDRKRVKADEHARALQRFTEKEKMKRVLLESGQTFGEDECLLMILNNGQIDGDLKPAHTYWTITCQSSSGQVLMADLKDVWRLFKNERAIIRFLKEQYCIKFPDSDITDTYQEEIMQSKMED